MDSTQKCLSSRPHPCSSVPLPLGESAPFPADFCQNTSFSPRLCCLFYRSLSLCCEGLRLLVMEVNLTNLWISLFWPCFLPLFSLVCICTYSSLLFSSPFNSFSYCASFSLNWCETQGYWLIIAENCSRRNAAVIYLRIQYLNLGNFYLVCSYLRSRALLKSFVDLSVYHCSKTERQYLTGLALF